VGRSRRTCLALAVALCGCAWLSASSASAASIVVTTTDDELNSDGDCSLREAVQSANTNAAVDACTASIGIP
jgi:CSLREA domain-containing protein